MSPYTKVLTTVKIVASVESSWNDEKLAILLFDREYNEIVLSANDKQELDHT